MLIWLALAAALAVAAAAGLFFAARLIPPDVKLGYLRPERLAAGRQTFRVGLRLDNANPIPLPILGMTYQLWLDEREIASGSSHPQRRVPRRGSADIEVLLSADAGHLARTLPRLALTPQPWRYRIEGSVSVLPQLRLPYRHIGEIDLKGIVRLAASLR